jgi:hypothetical protein
MAKDSRSHLVFKTHDMTSRFKDVELHQFQRPITIGSMRGTGLVRLTYVKPHHVA